MSKTNYYSDYITPIPKELKTENSIIMNKKDVYMDMIFQKTSRIN